VATYGVLNPDGTGLLRSDGSAVFYEGEGDPPEGCCCPPEVDPNCCTRKVPSLWVNLDAENDNMPTECGPGAGVVDVGNNWELPYDPVEDWYFGEDPVSGLQLGVWCEWDGVECKWYAQPFCQGLAANSEALQTIISENPIHLEGTATWNIDECLCNPLTGNPSAHISITE
jgi:hypothetical protein